MLDISYDLHIHSCLSPCANNEMTPNNIVNMAVLSGLDIIAITDHNSCKNCQAVMQAGKKVGLCVVPGMELCTSEEIHVICLFETLDCAKAFEEHIVSKSLIIKNKEDVFGQQIIMDCDDNMLGREDRLLLTSTNISICELPTLSNSFNAVMFPAHIDRTSFSIISVLGDFTDNPRFSLAEISNPEIKGKLLQTYDNLRKVNIIHNSDAHTLADIARPHWCIQLAKMSIESLISKLN